MSDAVQQTTQRFAIGAMSGTSIDSLDVAFVRLDGVGLDMQAALIEHAAEPLGDLTLHLRGIAEQEPVTAGQIASVAWQLGNMHVKLIERVCASSQPPPAIICVHGQTVFHRPPVSWQLINPAPIAARWPQARVISDLRQHDLVMGGQGAPITPLADWIMFRSESHSRAIVNLGGFCNITILPQTRQHEVIGRIHGFDVCACNHILDTIARDMMNTPYDEGGKRALAGTPHHQTAAQLREALSDQRAARRSLGTGDEVVEWVNAHRSRLGADDLAATACAAIGLSIADVIREHKVDQIILAGGGSLNEALTRAIASHAHGEVMHSDTFGVPAQVREAMAMAILGVLHVDGVPITLPQVTGRRA